MFQRAVVLHELSHLEKHCLRLGNNQEALEILSTVAVSAVERLSTAPGAACVGRVKPSSHCAVQGAPFPGAGQAVSPFVLVQLGTEPPWGNLPEVVGWAASHTTEHPPQWIPGSHQLHWGNAHITLTQGGTCGGNAVKAHEGIETGGSTSQNPFQTKGDKSTRAKGFFPGKEGGEQLLWGAWTVGPVPALCQPLA